MAPDGARDHELTIVADAKKGKSKGKQIARPILGTGRPTTVRMLSSMATCRFCIAMRGIVNHLLLAAHMHI